MKKKSPRGIPDFSGQPRRRPGAMKDGGPTPRTEVKPPPRPPAPPAIKPQSTSAKSGRRGQ